jgi:hypothetical protein
MKEFLRNLYSIIAGLMVCNCADVATSALTTSAPSATGIEQRTVSDTIRHLFPGFPTMSIVQSGAVGSDISKSRGLIRKTAVDGTKYECFNYSPLAVEFTVATYSSGTSFTVSSATGLCLKMCLVDTTNHTVARIGAISSTTITVTSVGDTTFSSAAGRKLLALAPVYAENSSSPYIMMKSEDNLYNILQINRFPSAISASNAGNPFYGKDYWQRVRKQVVMEGFRKVEHSAIFSERPSSTNLTTTDGTLTDAFRTTRGLWNWCVGGGASYDAGNAMTHEKFMKNLVLKMNDTVGSDSKLIMYCSRNIFADMIGWANEKVMITEQGELKKFGVKSKIFLTAGPEIEVIVHDGFNKGDNIYSALIFDAERVEFNFKKSRLERGKMVSGDFHPWLGIQANDVDGEEDDFIGEWGIGCDDGGSTMTRISNWG